MYPCALPIPGNIPERILLTKLLEKFQLQWLQSTSFKWKRGFWGKWFTTSIEVQLQLFTLFLQTIMLCINFTLNHLWDLNCWSNVAPPRSFKLLFSTYDLLRFSYAHMILIYKWPMGHQDLKFPWNASSLISTRNPIIIYWWTTYQIINIKSAPGILPSKTCSTISSNNIGSDKSPNKLVRITWIEGKSKKRKRKYLDNNRSNTFVHTKIGSGPTSILLWELPHYFHGFLRWFHYHTYFATEITSTSIKTWIPIKWEGDGRLSFWAETTTFGPVINCEFNSFRFIFFARK